MQTNSKRGLALGAALAGAAALAGGAYYYLRERSAPEPDYRTWETHGDFEIRAYPALIVAETIVEGARGEALQRGFRRLASYLKRATRTGHPIEMTAPVLQDGGDPMASQPPLFDDAMEGAWRTRFVMPAGRSRLDLPNPPPEVSLVDMAERRVAVVRFSGSMADAHLSAEEDRLRGWLARRGHDLDAAAEYAFYNSPMIPAPLRRLELWIPLS